jgi:hypothetical protein
MDEYCGKSLASHLADFIPKVHRWDPQSFLSRFSSPLVTLTRNIVAERASHFWISALTEYHAEHLYRKLEQSRISFSPEFLAFERVWRHDEYQHYLGFRSIYSLVSDKPIEEIAATIEATPADFSSINHFLDDEFKICLVLAYDEIATTKYYADELPAYAKFGDPSFRDWMKNVVLDEFCHFQNCVDIIRLRHRGRIAEVHDLVDQLIAWDKANNEYRNTFALDHFWYSSDFIDHCGQVLKRYISRTTFVS